MFLLNTSKQSPHSLPPPLPAAIIPSWLDTTYPLLEFFRAIFLGLAGFYSTADWGCSYVGGVRAVAASQNVLEAGVEGGNITQR